MDSEITEIYRTFIICRIYKKYTYAGTKEYYDKFNEIYPMNYFNNFSLGYEQMLTTENHNILKIFIPHIKQLSDAMLIYLTDILKNMITLIHRLFNNNKCLETFTYSTIDGATQLAPLNFCEPTEFINNIVYVILMSYFGFDEKGDINVVVYKNNNTKIRIDRHNLNTNIFNSDEDDTINNTNSILIYEKTYINEQEDYICSSYRIGLSS